MYQSVSNVTICDKMYQNVSKCIKMWQYVTKCITRCQNVSVVHGSLAHKSRSASQGCKDWPLQGWHALISRSFDFGLKKNIALGGLHFPPFSTFVSKCDKMWQIVTKCMEGHAMSEEGERSSMGIPRLASRFCRAQIDPSGHATWDSVPLSWGSESRRNGGRPVTYVEKFLYQTPSPWRSSTSWLGWWSQMRRKGLPTSRRSRAWWVSWLDSECGNQLQLSRDGGSSCIAPLAGDLAAVVPKLCCLNGSRSVGRVGSHGIEGATKLAVVRLGPRRLWELEEFHHPPCGRDQWILYPGGWWVRRHGGLRRRAFHPLHRSTPSPLDGARDLALYSGFPGFPLGFWFVSARAAGPVADFINSWFIQAFSRFIAGPYPPNHIG